MNTRKLLSTLATALFFGISLNAQISGGGSPYSTLAQLPSKDIVELKAPSVDMDAIQAEDLLRAQNGDMPLYSRLLPVGASVHSHGTWTTLSAGGRVGRLKLTTKNALANEIFFSDMYIPVGGSMFIYDESKTQVLGSFSAVNNRASGSFTTSLIFGESCIVEFYEPAGHVGEGRSHISQIGHAYRMIPGVSQKADPCQVDVNCSPEGAGWHAQRDGVVRISVQSSSGSGWCTGSVVNNTNYDCKPYILSAWHCGDGSSSNNFQFYKFYFRFQRPGCSSGSALASKVMTGCTKIADSEISASNDGSDFLLMELDDPIPDSFTPFFAGWDVSGSSSASGVSIHHPAGDEKKISTYTQSLTSSTWTGSPSQFHWRVFWTGTSNGHGVTEGGSSGSPIYDASGLIIGTLTGGASYCNTTVPNGQFQPDFYGKMSKHWEDNGTTNARKLKPWLDPANTGLSLLEGDYNPCGTYGIYTGIDELSSGAFDLFPNPASTQLTVEVSPEAQLTDIRIADAAGRIHISRSLNTAQGKLVLDLAGLAEGMYFLTGLKDGLPVYTAKFAKRGN